MKTFSSKFFAVAIAVATASYRHLRGTGGEAKSNGRCRLV